MPGALQRSQEREASQQQRIEELEQALQAARAAAEAGGGTRDSTSPEPAVTPAELLNRQVLLSLADWASTAADDSIPRPKGVITELQAHMGIPEAKKPYYNAIRHLFGMHMEAAGLVWYVYYRQQDNSNVQKFLLLMRHKVPFLRRFAAHWASIDIIRTILKNQRDEHRKANLAQDVALRATAFRHPPRKRPASPPQPPTPPDDRPESLEPEPETQPRPQPRPRRRLRDEQLPGDPFSDGREQRRSPPSHPASDDKDEDEAHEQPRPKRSRRDGTIASTARSHATAVSTAAKSTAKPRRKKTAASCR